MNLRFTFAALAAAAGGASASNYCPPISELKPDWPLSMLLKDVCKRESCSDSSCVNCQDIPPLIDILQMTYAADPAMSKNFELAGVATNFLCDPCLDPVRQAIIYLNDTDPNKPTIAGDAAVEATCSGSCISTFETVSTSFSVPKVSESFGKLQAECAKPIPDPDATAKALGDMMSSLTSSLDSVRTIAMGPSSALFEKAEHEAANTGSPSSMLSGNGALRIAAYSFIAIGVALIAASFLVKGPQAETDRSELL